MKQFAKFSVIIIVVAFASIKAIPGTPFGLVEVQVRQLAKRSTEKGGNSASVHVSGPGHNFSLALKNPETSIFTQNFKYTVAKEDGQGGVSFEDETPSEEALKEIESKIFVDKYSDSALSITQDKDDDDDFKVHGVLDNFVILPTNDEKDKKHQLIQVKSAPNSVSDYVDLHRNITPPKFSTRASVNYYQPEIWVIFDYDNSQTFGQDRTKILDYLGVFFNAINLRYATIGDPSISFRIAGVTTVSTTAAQPYLQKNKVPDGSGNDISKVLDDFSKWAFANQASGPKFDMAAVISGVDFQIKDSSGKYSKNVAGLAYLSAACYKTKDRCYATSITEDRPTGYYDGVYSVVHEFAHNLGAPHDGDGDAKYCPWSDGYLMSYKGWGTLNKFKFSPCSISLMKKYAASTEGSCVKSLQSSTNIPISSSSVGDRFDMKALCVKYTSQSSAVPEPTKTGDELCKNLSCRYPTPGKPAGYYSIVTLNHPPGDNSPCGTSGGKCVNGNCVVPTTI